MVDVKEGGHFLPQGLLTQSYSTTIQRKDRHIDRRTHASPSIYLPAIFKLCWYLSVSYVGCTLFIIETYVLWFQKIFSLPWQRSTLPTYGPYNVLKSPIYNIIWVGNLTKHFFLIQGHLKLTVYFTSFTATFRLLAVKWVVQWAAVRTQFFEMMVPPQNGLGLFWVQIPT